MATCLLSLLLSVVVQIFKRFSKRVVRTLTPPGEVVQDDGPTREGRRWEGEAIGSREEAIRSNPVSETN